MESVENDAPSPVPRGTQGIFRKTVFLSIAVACVTLAALATGVVLHERKLLNGHTADRAAIIAASMKGVSDAFVDDDYATVTDHCMTMVDSSENVLYAVVTRASDGFSLIHTPGARWEDDTLDGIWIAPAKGDGVREIDSELAGQAVFHGSYPFYYKGVHWGWIHIGLSKEAHASNLRNVLYIVGLLALPALLLGVASSFIFARRLTRPILALKRFAENVARGNLDEKAEIKTRDEVGQLAAAMNQMTGDLKRSQERIQESLRLEARAREHEILIKEIHHRVKNNMQILSSLMRMQGRVTESEALKNILRDGEARVMSMSLIHEKLYQSKSLSDIDFGAYCETLTSQLVQMLAAPGDDLSVKVDAEGIALPLDTALPCGLMINELISNAIKYAFPDRSGGTITISVVSEGEGNYHMVVADDGVGMPPLEERRKGSLGMRLVDMLSDQLDGHFEIKSQPGEGTQITIHFKESEYSNRV
jgi:two-component sensor histidine kinase/HAMP domain-containing protein